VWGRGVLWVGYLGFLLADVRAGLQAVQVVLVSGEVDGADLGRVLRVLMVW
jgi:hypothetical protein